MISNRLKLVFAVTAAMSVTGALQAAEPVPQHNTNTFWFENWGDLSNADLRIVLPGGKIENVRASSGTPVFRLTGPGVQDGVYRYELSAATSEREKIANPIDNGRGSNASDTVAKPFNMTGAFVVSRGVIVTPEEISETGDQ